MHLFHSYQPFYPFQNLLFHSETEHKFDFDFRLFFYGIYFIMLNRKITLNMFITHISVQYMFIHMYQSNAHEKPWCMCKWNILNGKMYTMNQMWILKAKKDILHSRYHMRYIVAAAAATDDVDTVFISDILWLYTMCNVYRKKRVDNSIHMK